MTVAAWNINGSASALWSDDHRAKMGKWDVIILTETHLTDTQTECQQPWQLGTHLWFQKVRKAHRGDNKGRIGRAHGGVAVGVRRDLGPENVTVMAEVGRDDVVWLRLDGGALGIDKPLYVGGVYVPPVNSAVHRQAGAEGADAAFAALAREALGFAEHGYILVGGDLNGRLGNRLEWTGEPEQAGQAGAPDDDMPADGQDLRELLDSWPRASADMETAGHETDIRSVCRTAGLAVLNGRGGTGRTAANTHVSGQQIGQADRRASRWLTIC